MQKVFVLDTHKKSLTPCNAARARQLLRDGKAAVYRRYPFTIILKRQIEEVDKQPLRLKIDPGSRITGVAIVNDTTGLVIWAAELSHRGQRIKDALESRRSLRRGRRSRKTRYRPARFLNRTKPKGWLAPSLMSRIYNIETWVRKLRAVCPISAISTELVRFDMQKMQNPEIDGVEYQQGELFGYEVREYLLEKWARKCAYCNAENVPLEVEHIVPKSRGGSNRVSNLTLACTPCNLKKGTQTAEEFGHTEIQAKARLPLKDAAAVNATRWKLYEQLKATGLPVEVGTGGRTKFNRSKQGLPKTHWLDAACVGASTPDNLHVQGVKPLQIKAMGRGKRQVCDTDKYGFRRRKKDGSYTTPKRIKRVYGFQTGDMVKAKVTKGKNAGVHTGRVRIRATGSFTLTTQLGEISTNWKNCTAIHRSDGYAYR